MFNKADQGWTEKHTLLFVLISLSLLESLFLPIALEILLIPILLKHYKDTWKITHVVFLVGVLGSMLSYMMGYYLYQTFEREIITSFSMAEEVEEMSEKIEENGFWLILSVAFTPVPLQLATFTSGIAEYDFEKFIGAIALARGIRYYALAALIWVFRKRVKGWVDDYMRHMMIAGILLTLLSTILAVYG